MYEIGGFGDILALHLPFWSSLALKYWLSLRKWRMILKNDKTQVGFAPT